MGLQALTQLEEVRRCCGGGQSPPPPSHENNAPWQSNAKCYFCGFWRGGGKGANGKRKRQTMPHPAQSQHTNYWAPRTRKRHQQEHRPQRPTERSDPTQHAKGRTGDCPGPRKGATTRRHVTQGGGGGCRPAASRRASGRYKPDRQDSPPSASPRRDGGVAGASTAGGAPAHAHQRPRGLFALGFTGTAAVTSPGDGEQEEQGGGAPAPPEKCGHPRARGTEGPTARKPEPLARVLLSCRVH